MSTVPVFSALCVVAAWLLCDFHRIGLFAADAGIRGGALVAALVGGAMLGWALDLRAVRATRSREALALVVLVPLVGLLVTSSAMVPAIRTNRSTVLTAGVVSSLALIPIVWLVLRAARDVGRARPHSLVDASDRRAVWTLVAALVSLGSVAAVHGAPQLAGFDWAGLEVSLSVSALAALVSIGCLVAELRALGLAASFVGAKLRPVEVDVDETSPAWIDLGLGDTASERLVGGSDGYRSRATVDAIVRGDPFTTNLALRRSVLRSLAGSGLALVGVALAFGVAA